MTFDAGRVRYGRAPLWHEALPSILLPLLALATWMRDVQGAEPPTYARDVARVLQKRCQSCHRPGQVAPFPLVTYEQARKRAEDLAAVVQERRMPPWKPARGVGPRFQDDHSLRDWEIALFTAWAEAGAPFGDRADLPPPTSFPEGWTLGKPDLVLEPAEGFPVPADGPDLYRCFVLPTNLATDVYITAVEFQPGSRQVVHHMMAFVDLMGGGRSRDAAEPGPGYTSYSGAGVPVIGDLGGWAAGNAPSHLPEGVGRALPRGADVLLQVHYHPTGKAELDRSRIGLYFARKPIRQTLHWNNVAIDKLYLPPGKSRIEIKATWYVPVDVEVLAVTPHMHKLGHDMRISVTFPDRRTQDLIYIPDWDDAWQSSYFLETPITLPRGSVVKLLAHFDNTATNPRNPNRPPKLVTWGYSTTDEMCVAYLGLVKKGQDLTQPGEKDDLFGRFLEQREDAQRRQWLSNHRR